MKHVVSNSSKKRSERMTDSGCYSVGPVFLAEL